MSSAVLDHQLPASGPWSPTLNAPASGLSFHTFWVQPAMKPSARFGLQAVGSLWAMDTCLVVVAVPPGVTARSEEHTSELQSLMRISYAVFCLKKKTKKHT